MNQQIIDGILVTRPTQDDILNLKVGDLAPDCFGRMSKVVEIYALSKDVKGKWFVCYYVEFGPNAKISESLKEGEPLSTVPATAKWSRSENIPKWEGYKTVERSRMDDLMAKRQMQIAQNAPKSFAPTVHAVQPRKRRVQSSISKMK